MLIAAVLVSASVGTSHAEILTVELVELEPVLEDLMIETDAPEPPSRVAELELTEADSTLPNSPSLVPIFRPPRSSS